MVKLSIRNASARSRMATSSLQTIIAESNARSSDIDEYFRIKMEKGTHAVPKAVLDGAVILAFLKKMEKSSDMKSCVSCILNCFDEFSMNSEVQAAWHSFYKEIAELIYNCLNFLVKAIQHDWNAKTSTSIEAVRLFNKLCYLLNHLSAKDEDLCTELFKMCAKDLMSMFMSKSTNAELQSAILSAVCELSQKSNKSCIAKTFENMSIHLKCLAFMILNLPVEAQESAYTILVNSLSGVNNRNDLAGVWFCRWPPLRDSFIESLSKNFDQGCGMFLNKLENIKSSLEKRDTSLSSCAKTPASIIQMKGSSAAKIPQTSSKRSHSDFHQPSLKRTQVDKEGFSKSIKKIESKEPSKEIEPQEPQDGCSKSTKKTTFQQPHQKSIEVGGHTSNKKTLKLLQTPYYPDNRKSLSLRKQQDVKPIKPHSHGGDLPPPTISVKSSEQVKEKKMKNNVMKGAEIGLKIQSNNSDKEKSRSVKTGGAGELDIVLRSKPMPAQTPSPPSTNCMNTESENVKNLSLLDLEEEESEKSKVERWLTTSSFGNSNLKSYFEDGMETEKGPRTAKKRKSDVALFSENEYSHKIRSTTKPSGHISKYVTNVQSQKLKNVPCMKKKEECQSSIHEKQQNRGVLSKLNTNSSTLSKLPVEEKSEKYVSDNSDCDSLQSAIKRWDRKLKEQQHIRNEKKVVSDKIYNFDCSPQPFKKPRVPSKKSAPGHSSARGKKSAKCEVVKYTSSNKSRNKENISPITVTEKSSSKAGQESIKSSRNTFGVIQQSETRKSKENQPSRIKKTGKILQTLDKCPSICSSIKTAHNETNCEESMGMTTKNYYSPIQDDSIEIAQNGKAFSLQKEMPTSSGMVLNDNPKSKLRVPQQCGDVTNRELEDKCKVQKPRSSEGVSMNEVPKPSNANVADCGLLNNCKLQNPVCSEGLAENNHKTDSHNKFSKSFKKNENKQIDTSKSKDIDSGFDVTSASEFHSPPLKKGSTSQKAVPKKHSPRFLRIQMDLRDYIRRAKEENLEMVSNNNVMTSEVLQIKELAEKIAASATRCQSITSNDHQRLSQQSNYLENCSVALGPFEDQSFKPLFPCTVYSADNEAMERQRRARNKRRMLKIVQKALREDLSFSSSDSE